MARELEKVRRKDPKAVLFPESIVNFMGYEHLQFGDIRGALEIMKLNAAACTKSANAYDSLSDAYLADGQRELTRPKAEIRVNAQLRNLNPAAQLPVGGDLLRTTA